jgi:esterase/lipase
MALPMTQLLFLHGMEARPGGVKPQFLQSAGFEVLNPALSAHDFAGDVQLAQAALDEYGPSVVVGSSRGGAVALALESTEVSLVLLAPAWHWFLPDARLTPRSVILHSAHDALVPLEHSRLLLERSGLGQDHLVIVGDDHRMNDAASRSALLEAIARFV